MQPVTHPHAYIIQFVLRVSHALMTHPFVLLANRVYGLAHLFSVCEILLWDMYK